MKHVNIIVLSLLLASTASAGTITGKFAGALKQILEKQRAAGLIANQIFCVHRESPKEESCQCTMVVQSSGDYRTVSLGSGWSLMLWPKMPGPAKSKRESASKSAIKIATNFARILDCSAQYTCEIED